MDTRHAQPKIWLNQMKGVHHKQLVHQIVKEKQVVRREIHEAQKERQSKCKYHHKSGRKGYVGVAEDLYEKNVVEKGEEIDRALLWKYARKDKNGEIVDKEVALMAEKILSTN
ncbi:uncharacterized protein Pyn_26790 [Prunus yedoensis var. nudiflora]|uniref:Uncharacterized protein n=1 Tax=Prunus yedoensis var. nudiflora TaxID=2094558 RepID=A0A314XLL2_PRUYE|nr:uncharacterized protein Pyn_26790 [Prunus yedoensis var. nudiflora]